MSELSIRLPGGTGKLEVLLMTILTNLSRLAIISALSFSFFSSGATSDAIARAADLTKTINCTGIPADVETTTLTIDLERFSIPAEWSDPGSQYEISTHYVIKVYPNPGSKTVICQSNGNWGTRDYNMYNAWTGNRWNYPLELRIVINNFPVQGYAWFDVWMKEEDSGLNANDWMDLNPYPIFGNLEFNVYPASQRAFLLRLEGENMVEVQNSIGMVVFGRSKRFVGDGGKSGGEGGEACAGTSSVPSRCARANIRHTLSDAARLDSISGSRSPPADSAHTSRALPFRGRHQRS